MVLSLDREFSRNYLGKILLIRKPRKIIVTPCVSVLEISQNSGDELKIFHYKKLQLPLSKSHKRSWAAGWEGVGSAQEEYFQPFGGSCFNMDVRELKVVHCFKIVVFVQCK